MPGTARGTSDSWWGATDPPTNVTLAATTWVGVSFMLAADLRIFGFRVHVVLGQTPLRALLWDANTGDTLCCKQFFPEASAGTKWAQCWIHPTVRIPVGDRMNLCILQRGSYRRQNSALVTPVTHGNIQFLTGFQTTSLNPPDTTLTMNSNANGVDILLEHG